MVRTAALLCGLVAGLFALVVPIGVDSDLLTPFLKIWASTPGQRMLGTVAWYAPAAMAMLGGLLAVLTPGFAALLLLGAAVGWFGISLSDTQLFDYQLLAPAGLGLLGSLLSFFAGEVAVRQQRAARRVRKTTTTGNREDGDVAAVEREAAFRMDPRLVPREEAPPRPAREIPLTLEDVIPREATPEPPKRKPETIWPEPPSKRSVFERPVEPQRRSAVLERAEPGERPRGDYDYSRPTPPASRINRFVLWLAAVNGVAVIGLGIAVGYLIIENRQPAAPVATNVAEAAPVATPEAVEAKAPAAVETPAIEAAPAETEAVPTPAEADDQRLTPNLLPALPQPAAIDAAPDAQPAEIPLVAAAGYADPYQYCGAVETIDYVDRRYGGPAFTADIAEALRVPLRSAPDRVSWRCVDGVVYACASFDWPVCAMTPTADEMLEYCRRNPSVGRLLAPNGTWSCEAGKPKLPEGASWPVDERGFFPAAWIPVLPPETPPAG